MALIHFFSFLPKTVNNIEMHNLKYQSGFDSFKRNMNLDVASSKGKYFSSSPWLESKTDHVQTWEDHRCHALNWSNSFPVQQRSLLSFSLCCANSARAFSQAKVCTWPSCCLHVMTQSVAFIKPHFLLPAASLEAQRDALHIANHPSLCWDLMASCISSNCVIMYWG